MNEAPSAPVEQSSAPVAPETTETKPKDFVTYETHRKLLDEKKKIAERLTTLESERKAREEDEARKRGDFETLLKTRDEELVRLRGELTTREQRENNARKLAAVLDTVGGEVESKWYSLIDVSSIVLHPETGEIDQMSVTKTVEALRKTWPEMIKNPNPAKLPSNAPLGNGAGKISRDEWLKLPSKEMAKWKPDQII